MILRPRHIAHLFLLVFLSACRDDKRIVDESRPLKNHTWSYSDKLRFDVKIEDASKPYNLYLNLRHTPYYAYSNFFAIVHQISPEKKRYSMRFEFKLALPDGEWFGQGSGNLYSHQIPFRKNYHFPKPGTYRIDIEQNMRDNPLREVTDAGLRVEEAN